MKVKLLLSIALPLLLAVLVLGVSQAQEPDIDGAVKTEIPGSDEGSGVSLNTRAAAATAANAFSYQGVLKESGEPVTGDRSMVFRLYANAGCTTQVGADIPETVSVVDGLFNVSLAVDPHDFYGGALWLEIQVNGTSVGCQEILPVPYALSLRPGAVMSGPVAFESVYGGPVLRIKNTLNGRGLYVESAASYAGFFKSDTWGGVGAESVSYNGVRATSVNDDGIYAQSDHADGIQAVGGDDVGDYGGKFSGHGGVHAVANSSAGVPVAGFEAGYDIGDNPYSDPGGLFGGTNGVVGLTDDNVLVGVIGYHGASSGSTYGVMGAVADSDNNYGLYTPDNLYSLNYHLMGAVMQVVQNGGQEALEPGDVVAFSGVAVPLEADSPPVIQVAMAETANSTAVAGVVYGRFNIDAVTGDVGRLADPETAKNMDATPGGPAEPGDYLLVVVHGPAQVKASALTGAIQPGELLASAEESGHAAPAARINVDGVQVGIPGVVFGKALEALDDSKALIYVYVTLQ